MNREEEIQKEIEEQEKVMLETYENYEEFKAELDNLSILKEPIKLVELKAELKGIQETEARILGIIEEIKKKCWKGEAIVYADELIKKIKDKEE